ncbi:hybrid sensor histidine kinase/response regulator [Maridesulfovibrio bastinii]|uniref:hybrid sensor histidine kinase/response regulator n=1 Tax=Maridesulfovibrio bastinii TaxID=47157 RepID=UPI000427B469|nr:hybrid sensor histidine kinase/response regulator [Maridesulfovibrio bastinii]
MGGKRILVVDDEKIVNLDIQVTLRRLGYDIAGEAVTGEEALQKAASLSPDLVLMDIKLRGEMDGIEAADLIIRNNDIPVVFLTAYSDEQTLNRAKLSGPFGYLLKPFEERDLRSAIEVALYKHTMEQDLKLAIREAESANEAKSSFLATVSHELRTPMNGIMGLTDILLSSRINAEQRDYLKLIKESAASLLGVLNDLLDYAKIEARILELREGVFDLKKSLQATIQAHESLAKRKGLFLECNIDPDVPLALKGDSGRLSQILNNLVSNAIKFTDDGGVVVEVFVKRGLPDKNIQSAKIVLEFSVSDTGVGIPQTKADKIFESFTQLENYMTRNKGGVGLGLTISYKLVSMLRGEIWMETEPAQGSDFHFTAEFELAGKQKKSDEQSISAQVSKFSKPYRILLADDNMITRRVVETFLGRMGCELEIVENGIEAINMLEKKNFDLVIMDVQMPVMDGFEATRIIRSGKTKNIRKDIPVLALTAHAMKGDRERCLDVGMSGYLAKPVSAGSLMSGIMSVLDAAENDADSTKNFKKNDSDPVLDIEGTLGRFEGNDALVREVYSHFMRTLPGHVAKLDEFSEVCDVDSMVEQAGIIRGMALDAGAKQISRSTVDIEKTVRTADIDAIQKAVSKLKKQSDLTLSAMAEYLFKSD